MFIVWGSVCMEWMPLENLFYQCASPFSAKHIMPSTLDILVIWVILYIVLWYYKFYYHVPGVAPVHFMPLKFQGRKVFCPGTTYQTHTWHMSWIAVEYCPEYYGHHWDFHCISTCKWLVWKFSIMTKHLYGTRIVFLNIAHIPGRYITSICTCRMHLWNSFIFACLIFCTFPQHGIHLYMWVAYFNSDI